MGTCAFSCILFCVVPHFRMANKFDFIATARIRIHYVHSTLQILIMLECCNCVVSEVLNNQKWIPSIVRLFLVDEKKRLKFYVRRKSSNSQEIARYFGIIANIFGFFVVQMRTLQPTNETCSSRNDILKIASSKLCVCLEYKKVCAMGFNLTPALQSGLSILHFPFAFYDRFGLTLPLAWSHTCTKIIWIESIASSDKCFHLKWLNSNVGWHFEWICIL